jgi:pyrimidine-nucleoside phosphorylase
MKQSNMGDIILKKRDGGVLTEEEIRTFIEGYTDGSIPDYQAAALLMSIFFQGMEREEIFALTDAMTRSGDVVDLSSIAGTKVDKHSSGGVGDKTTLVATPLAAACGVPVAKMSGRGLGFTGGTVDKMDAIPGMRTTLKAEEFLDQVNRIGIAVIGQTGHIAPADKKLYALRDVTATVDSLPLITSSIMSKKLASGSDAFVLDVKYGNGSFMATAAAAAELGRLMVEIGTLSGKKTIALITSMEQPLGLGIGNAIEVMEAIETLKGRGPADLTELCLQLASYMVFAGGKANSPESGYALAREAMESGRGLSKFRAFVEAQGGNPDVADDATLFPQAAHSLDVTATRAGYITEIAAGSIGTASQRTGAGRERKEDTIDLSAGIVLCKKVGDAAAAGESLCTLYGNDRDRLNRAAEMAREAFVICEERKAPAALVHAVIT